MTFIRRSAYGLISTRAMAKAENIGKNNWNLPQMVATPVSVSASSVIFGPNRWIFSPFIQILRRLFSGLYRDTVLKNRPSRTNCYLSHHV